MQDFFKGRKNILIIVNSFTKENTMIQLPTLKNKNTSYIWFYKMYIRYIIGSKHKRSVSLCKHNDFRFKRIALKRMPFHNLMVYRYIKEKNRI